MREETVIRLLRRRCRQAGGQLPFAKQHGLSHSNISRTLSGNKGLEPAILRALGLERITIIRRIPRPTEDEHGA